MRILFDAYWYVSGPPSQRHVLREMIHSWRREFPEDCVSLLCRRRDRDSLREELGAGVALVGSRIWPHGLMIILRSAAAARVTRSEIVISHNFTGPSRAATATFIHDFLFLDHPSWFTFAERRYFSLMRLSARWADTVFTSSLTEANRIQKYLPKKPVVPVGIGMSDELVSSDADAQIASKLSLSTGSYLLTVGRLNVRKNLELTLLAALETGKLSPAFPLVVVGEKNGKAVRLPDNIQEAISDGRIVLAGYVSDGELKWLYQNTRLFIFLSLGEGFGMPPLEALYLGAPALVSDLPIFRETMGESASFVDPTALGEAASKIRDLTAALPADADSGDVFSTYQWSAVVRSIRVEAMMNGLEISEKAGRT